MRTPPPFPSSPGRFALRLPVQPRALPRNLALLIAAFCWVPSALAALPAADHEPALGFAHFILGTERAQVPTDSLRCGPARNVPSREVCSGSWQIETPTKILLLGIWISEMQLLFSDNKLVRVDAMFDSRRFDLVLDGLRLKYGNPDESREVLSGGPGIRIAGRREIWRPANGVIVAREATSVPYYSSIRFYASGWAPIAAPATHAGSAAKISEKPQP